MPDIPDETGSVLSGGAISSLEQQIAEAKVELNEQREKIARLTAEGHDVTDARRELLSKIENLAFLIKLRSSST